jgi:hypothetical protein
MESNHFRSALKARNLRTRPQRRPQCGTIRSLHRSQIANRDTSTYLLRAAGLVMNCSTLCYGGPVAFVDDFTAWVTGPTVESNRDGTKEIIKKALDWERRSGATFEAEKTAIIHFTRKAYKSNAEPFAIRGQLVRIPFVHSFVRSFRLKRLCMLNRLTV